MDSLLRNTKVWFFGDGRGSKPYLHIYFVIFFIFTSTISAWAQQEEGDWCVTDDGEDGICRPLLQCPYLVAQPWIYNNAGPNTPGLCFYSSSRGAITCCPVEMKARSDLEEPDVRVNSPPLSRPGPESDYGDTVVYSAPEKNSNTPRISELKCQEYKNELDGPNGCILPPQPAAFIIGGYRAKLGEYPHMAALGYTKFSSVAWLCGGTLISHRYILTAAHCTKAEFGKLIVVRLGQLLLQSVQWSSLIASTRSRIGSSGDHPVGSVTRHPDYKTTSAYNDIALVRLLDPIETFDDMVRPACLYTEPEVNEISNAQATGWGFTESGGDNIEVRSLLQVDLKLYDRKRCSKEYQAESHTSHLSRGITDSMLCAGDLDGGRDTCQGDSGGPLQVRDANLGCLYRVVGVTSLGKACGLASMGVYTKVSSYLPWIESIVWPEGK